MLEGIVQFYLPDKKFGYIRVVESREEFHFSGKNQSYVFKKGDRVQFRLIEDKHGLQAVEVNVLPAN